MLEIIARVRLNLMEEKLEFHQKEVTYLRLIISNSGIHMNMNKVAVLESWPVPDCDIDIRSFLEFANFYEEFF